MFSKQSVNDTLFRFPLFTLRNCNIAVWKVYYKKENANEQYK